MDFLDRIVVVCTKCISVISKTLGFGAGATWPGEIALMIRPNILRILSKRFNKGIILVAGTNGKTTTTLMIHKILESTGAVVVHNATGANLVNGIVSACISMADWRGKIEADFGVFEVDENSLPIVFKSIKSVKSKVTVVLLNLFRDQLDRYGEVDVIIEKWKKAFGVESDKFIKLIKTKDIRLILNADDPAIASLGDKHSLYFGLNDPKKFLKTKEHATDSTFCPKCRSRLMYDGVYYSHVGIWRCEHCGNTRPKPMVFDWPQILPGLYNQYNTLAAVALAKSLDIPDKDIKVALKDFSPAFGRQEEVVVNGKIIKLFLSKNPAGFNASLRAALEMGAKNILLVLNDRIPDGRDVSWIWDVDFEMIPKDVRITVSGDRVYDMALRMKYAGLGKFIKLKVHKVYKEEGQEISIEPDLHKAIDGALKYHKSNQILYILATYSAMLEVRKILTGKKIQ